MPAIAFAAASPSSHRRRSTCVEVVLLFLLAAWPGLVPAGVAFSCTGPDGSIMLTDQPCGRDARSKTYRTLDALARTADEAKGPKRRREAGEPEAGAAPGTLQTARPIATTAAAAASQLSGVRPATGGSVSNRGNQKVAICAALAEERGLAQKQLRGEATPQAGENPNDNLALIERQWTRVGCAGLGISG